jgi:hypothetical protein
MNYYGSFVDERKERRKTFAHFPRTQNFHKYYGLRTFLYVHMYLAALPSSETFMCVSYINILFVERKHKNVSPVNVSISHHFSSECKNFITIKAWIWHKKRFEKFKMYFLSTSLFLKFSLSIYILNIYSYVKN